MKAVREKFLTVVEAEKVTGVHYTVNHSGKMEGMQSLSTSCLCNEYCKNRLSNSELVCSQTSMYTLLYGQKILGLSKKR